MVVPIRTGVTMVEGTAASSGTREVTTLMPHAEVALRVTAPDFNFRISFYQGIEGFTGWHAGATRFWRMHGGEMGEHKHSVRVATGTCMHDMCMHECMLYRKTRICSRQRNTLSRQEHRPSS